jgi:branched-chain amino acid transport system ATP-binding protein
VTSFSAHISQAGYGRLSVVDDVAIESASGALTVILGSNGAGKSTTLRAVIGTVRSKRRLLLDGRDVTHLPPWKLPHEGVVFVPDGARAFPNLSIIENLTGAFMAVATPGQRQHLARRLDKVFAIFPVLKARQQSVAGTLSGGQRQMLAVGRALMAEPRVLLLDEPSAGLAPKIVEELFEALETIKVEQGCAIVMAEQNVGYASRIADNCIVLEQGKMVLCGPMSEVAGQDRLRTAYLGL